MMWCISVKYRQPSKFYLPLETWQPVFVPMTRAALLSDIPSLNLSSLSQEFTRISGQDHEIVAKTGNSSSSMLQGNESKHASLDWAFSTPPEID